MNSFPSIEIEVIVLKPKDEKGYPKEIDKQLIKVFLYLHRWLRKGVLVIFFEAKNFFTRYVKRVELTHVEGVYGDHFLLDEFKSFFNIRH